MNLARAPQLERWRWHCPATGHTSFPQVLDAVFPGWRPRVRVGSVRVIAASGGLVQEALVQHPSLGRRRSDKKVNIKDVGLGKTRGW